MKIFSDKHNGSRPVVFGTKVMLQCSFCKARGIKRKTYVTIDGEVLCTRCRDQLNFCYSCGSVENSKNIQRHYNVPECGVDWAYGR